MYFGSGLCGTGQRGPQPPASPIHSRQSGPLPARGSPKCAQGRPDQRGTRPSALRTRRPWWASRPTQTQPTTASTSSSPSESFSSPPSTSSSTGLPSNSIFLRAFCKKNHKIAWRASKYMILFCLNIVPFNSFRHCNLVLVMDPLRSLRADTLRPSRALNFLLSVSSGTKDIDGHRFGMALFKARRSQATVKNILHKPWLGIWLGFVLNTHFFTSPQWLL